jgi:NADPH-dependent 2,4-dienoyl-CoA reductase/sulfur reductase-like enzyme
MIKTDVLIIGGGPAGIITAVTSRATYPNKKVLVIRERKDLLVPCALPYIFGNMLPNTEKDLVPDQHWQKSGAELIIDTITKVDISNKIAHTETDTISFEKLVFATGSVPNTPKIEGVESNGVFTVPKDRDKIDKLKSHIDNLKTDNIVVVGTGFIGVEIAGELLDTGKNVYLIGGSDRVLKNAFDDEFSERIENILVGSGVKLLNKTRVKKIISDEVGNTQAVEFTNGNQIKTEAVILAIGYHPNTQLAKDSGIRVGIKGGIWVDEYMRTDFNGVFAVGDCAEKKNFLTRELSGVMLASTATAEARIVGSSLYGIQYVKGFHGTIGTFSTVMGNKCFSSVGMTEQEAQKEKFDYVTGSFEGVDKHPATLPNTHKQMVKLIAMKRSGILIGGQVTGGKESGELINLISLMVENKMSIYSILTLQVATHPLLTAGPTAYPIIKSAEQINNKINSCLV